ncbi:RNA polymerase sigma factor [Sinanaerobacter sp. ZZT-01]|uniref:RNA polymerase sigma factor n=1 Tax=Sinanaerobacter sp. ZZT-01 TaxID=3111540 RepID=UPI002D77B409|nr:sigma-70 family RNA polymerase sigma factor [Sinanaerobacter sp. ZZT-01]WRR93202.1 sigma-70 family RNA polymerase sigma factor [Sinanaerobacter sp. ZZT-01]
MDKREKELITRAKTGDETSFEQLIESCKTKAYNIAWRYMRNEQDALDALQESFIKVFRHLGKFKGESSFDTWVYRIVVNTCNDMLRKNNNLKAVTTVFANDEEEVVVRLPDTGPTPWEALERKEKSQFILDCLETLQPDQKEIIILRDIHGFSYQELTEVLECSIGTVKSRINRARKRLKQIIMEHKEKNIV